MEPFIGTIMAFGFNFPPKGWASCNGALLPIRQYTALFSLLGTYYGGDGQTTFGLPNLQGRTAIGFGNNIQIGEVAGATTHTVSLAEMPAHMHPANSTIAIPVMADTANQPTPSGNALAISSGTSLYSNSPADGSMPAFTANGTMMPAGSGIPVQTMSPYLVMNYSIAINGLFPSRN